MENYDYRSEEHTSELQSHLNLVCRLLLEKKKPLAPLVVLGAARAVDRRDVAVGFPVPLRQRECFFFNDTATTEIYTLSLHDALPIKAQAAWREIERASGETILTITGGLRSEEHTSELQSHLNLVCRLLLEKKKN